MRGQVRVTGFEQKSILVVKCHMFQFYSFIKFRNRLNKWSPGKKTFDNLSDIFWVFPIPKGLEREEAIAQQLAQQLPNKKFSGKKNVTV